MTRDNVWRAASLLFLGAILFAAVWALGPRVGNAEPREAETFETNDSHFHLTNYVQEGTNIHDTVRTAFTR